MEDGELSSFVLGLSSRERGSNFRFAISRRNRWTYSSYQSHWSSPASARQLLSGWLALAPAGLLCQSLLVWLVPILAHHSPACCHSHPSFLFASARSASICFGPYVDRFCSCCCCIWFGMAVGRGFPHGGSLIPSQQSRRFGRAIGPSKPPQTTNASPHWRPDTSATGSTTRNVVPFPLLLTESVPPWRSIIS
jgi:hypothetical protein